ncbi:MAG TPA: hypothetical protein VK158_01640 [Acidobacteriota bacterium]|nr:hypothetical protein [Acidobacteriota bacterium]
MKRIIIAMLLILTLLSLTACNANVHLCDAPYMPYGTGCCYDKNQNAVCDLDETSGQTPQTNAT